MIPTAEILMIIAAIQGFWTAWIHYKTKEVELKYNKLCDNCQFDFTPKNGIKPTEQ